MAFKELFERHREKLFLFLVRIIKSRETSEEIVIDIFLKLWLGKEFLPEIQDLDAFLHKVAYNKAIDFFRAASRSVRLQKLIRHEMESATEKQADSKLLDTEYNSILQKAVEHLSPQRRAIFTFSRVEGLSHEEIAIRLNLSRNTVRNTIADSLRSIRQFLQTHDITNILIILLLLVREWF